MKPLRKLRALFRRKKLDAEMAEELRGHLELQTERNLADGLSPEEARYAARRQFGGVEQVKEQARAQRGLVWLENVLRDLALGARLLRKHPGFTAVAVLTLALGIGSCTAIFSVVNAILFRRLDYPEPERIMVLRELTPPPSVRENVVSPRNFLDWRERARSFSHLAAWEDVGLNFTGGSEPEQLQGDRVTGDYFGVFGTRPVQGRLLTDADARPGNERVAVLSFAFWQRAFGGATDVVGRTLRLNDEVYAVVGVAAAMPGRTDVWIPLAFTPDQSSEQNRGAHWLRVAGRLRAGVTPAQASTELKSIAGQIGVATPSYAGWSALVMPLLDYNVKDGRTALLTLLGAVGCVLLIACANVSNLLLARATARAREISIRAALGAGRSRLIGQMLTESFLLAGGGGILGVLLARWGLQAATAYAPSSGPAPTLDLRVLSFAVAASVVSGVVFGLAPAWFAARTGVQEALKRGARGATETGSRRLRSSLIVGEIAVTVVLLALAGLLGRSFLALAHSDPGFVAENATVLRLTLPEKRYPRPEQQAIFAEALLAQIRGLPGVHAAGVTHVMPMLSGQGNGFLIQGRPTPEHMPVTSYFAVTPGYFPAMGVRLLRGRLLNAQDDARAPHVAVINETLARQQFPGEDPLGQRINFEGGESQDWREIVGVVADVAQSAVDRKVAAQSYEPFAQQPRPYINVVIRSSGQMAAGVLGAQLRSAVQAVDQDQPVGSILKVGEVLSGGLARPRFTAVMLGTFSTIALIIAAIGLYGVMAYNVAQRTSEFGIRLALGAQPTDLVRRVLLDGGKLVGIGWLLGVAAAVAAARVIQSMLFQVSPHDPVTLVGIGALLGLAAVVACLVPAWRATRVDPVVALRAE
jgi:putative ABC transport system permease protein